MKVLFIANSDFGKPGAIGLRTFHVAKEAYKRGCLGSIICRGDCQDEIPKEYIQAVFPGYRLFNLGLSFINQYVFKKFPARNIQIKTFDWLVSKKIKKFKKQGIDVMHTYEYAPRTIEAAKKLGIKVVRDTQMAHGKAAEKIFNTKSDYENETLTAELADKLIVSSDFVVQSYLDIGFPREKMSLIPFGVDLKKFNFKREEDPNHKFICLFVGIIEPRKGVEYLLKAWEELNLKNAELVLCGRINLTMRDVVNDYKKNKSINFTGYTDPVAYYKSADVFLFPSLFESSAKVLNEALASSLPVITTFNSGPIFKDGEAGFIIPIKDVEAIKEKIKYFYDHPEEARRMGAVGRRIVENYSWDSYGKRIMAVYEKLLNEN